MQPRHFKDSEPVHPLTPAASLRRRGAYLALWLLALAIALLGCDDSTDNVTALDVENRTFIFDSSFIDDELQGLTTTLAFGAMLEDDRVSFTLTLRDNATGTDAVVVSDIAIVGSIRLPIGDIELRGETLPDPIEFDVHVDEADAGTLEYTFTNDNGAQLLFAFAVGELSASATPIRP